MIEYGNRGNTPFSRKKKKWKWKNGDDVIRALISIQNNKITKASTSTVHELFVIYCMRSKYKNSFIVNTLYIFFYMGF